MISSLSYQPHSFLPESHLLRHGERKVKTASIFRRVLSTKLIDIARHHHDEVSVDLAGFRHLSSSTYRCISSGRRCGDYRRNIVCTSRILLSLCAPSWCTSLPLLSARMKVLTETDTQTAPFRFSQQIGFSATSRTSAHGQAYHAGPTAQFRRCACGKIPC